MIMLTYGRSDSSQRGEDKWGEISYSHELISMSFLDRTI